MALPPGYSPPAYANTPDDRGGWAVVVSGVGLVLILLFTSIRLYTRYPFRSRLLYDDIAIIVSAVFTVIHNVLIISAVSQGLGKADSILEPATRQPTEKTLYASGLLYIIALFSSRTALLCFQHTLSPEKWHKLLARCGIIVCLLMTIVAVFMIAFGCSIQSPWLQISQLCDEYVRWIVILAFGIALESLILAISMRMLFMLQRNWTGKMKATVVFGLRLPIVVIATYRLISLRDFRSTSDPFLDRVILISWTQCELVYSLATSIIPSLMPFLMKMNTGLGGFSRETMIRQTTHQESGGSYAMQPLKPSQNDSRVSDWETTRQVSRSQLESNATLQMRPDNVEFQSMVVSQSPGRRSVSSDDSQQVMIRKTVDIGFSERTSSGLSGNVR